MRSNWAVKLKSNSMDSFHIFQINKINAMYLRFVTRFNF